jgi:TnpA family transposase
MPRRELLTAAQRGQLLALPDEAGDLIRLFTLSSEDLAFVRQHRGAHNRLGVAVQLGHLRYPGRVLGPNEAPDGPALEIIASQVGIATSAWDSYAVRDQTRREHLSELLRRLGMRQFDRSDARSLKEWLLPTAMQTTRAMPLAEAMIAELRRRRILLPSLAVIERLCAEALTQARRRAFQVLTDGLDDERRAALDQLLEPRTDGGQSVLAWLRAPPGAPTARSILSHAERLDAVRALGVTPELGRRIPQNRLFQLAREGAQTAVFQLKEYEPRRRHATLVAVLIETAATLTDEILDLHDRLIGGLFARAKNRYRRSFAEAGKAINDKVRLYARVGAALLDAKASRADPFAAIEAVLPWDRFAASVEEARRLAREADFDHLELVAESYGQVRRYAPVLLATFGFHGAPAVRELIAGLETLRGMYLGRLRNVPEGAPVGFVRKRWRPFVFRAEGIDRRFYELCLMAELKNALRAGDLSVVGSRQFRNFEDYLMTPAEFGRRREEGTLGVSVPAVASEYLEQRSQSLREALDQTAALAGSDELPDAELTEEGLRISPLDRDVPAGVDDLKAVLQSMLPHARITDVLLEVDRWTGFSRHFTHLKTGEPADERVSLLTAVLADGINLGLAKISEASPGASLSKLSWLVAWHVRDETYGRALAELVNYQHRLPLTRHWGAGTTSSSDGQRFQAGGRGEAAGDVNARYGHEPGVTFYTHVSDRYAPFHTKVINTTVRDATHVLDGLLYHESDLRIEEHYTDTAGFTDHVFALCHLLGFRFAPRIRDLADKRLYVPGRPSQWPAMRPLIGGPLNRKLIEGQFGEVLRLASSIRHGTVTASLILRKLGSYPRQNSLALALREVGRLERSLFLLQVLRDPGLRRRIHVGLNKGEARNALARAVFFNRLGELRDRSFENQRHRASGLNLLVAAITLWNTVYLERSVAGLLERGVSIDESLLPHISPLGWEHINLTGDYIWGKGKLPRPGQFRPLRPPQRRALRP